MVLAMGLLTGTQAAAERLLSPVAATPAEGAAAAMPGVARVQALALSRPALVALRAERAMAIDAFPLGADRTADVDVVRFDPFAPGARVQVMDAGGSHALSLPDRAYFSGTVRGEPESRVLLIAGTDAVQGFVAVGGQVYVYGPDGAGGHRGYALADVDPAVYPPPRDFCANGDHPELADTPGERALASGLLPPPVEGAPATLKQADVALETDQELRAKFGSDQAALDWIASLAAAATAIYERDVSVRLRVSYVRLWGAAATDPWTATSTTGSLDEVQAYWVAAANDMDTIAGPHDLVHFVSGKPVQGGVAYVNALCSRNYGFGVSQVHGSFDPTKPSTMWDVMVFAHELGHNFGSPHSHCYSPPLDKCYNQEAGCYSGAVVSSRGTIMSYCHLLGGVGNIDFTFGPVVSARIGTSVAGAACLAAAGGPVCGNGVVEAGEQCDDGNNANGDCCSSQCQREAAGSPCTSDGDACTTDACDAGGTCIHTPISPCGTTTSTTSTTTTTTTRRTTTSTVTVTTTSTSSTSTPAAPDGDRDGVPDAQDACPKTPSGDLVDDRGCSVCPCAGMPGGEPWPSGRAYMKCVREAILARAKLGQLTIVEARAALREKRHATCGRAKLTRCCLYPTAADTSGRCRMMSPTRCEAVGVRLDMAEDLGPGSCMPSPCER
jgi:cysteine-rich repeat protein